MICHPQQQGTEKHPIFSPHMQLHADRGRFDVARLLKDVSTLSVPMDGNNATAPHSIQPCRFFKDTCW
jgi:hypothetical protein